MKHWSSAIILLFSMQSTVAARKASHALRIKQVAGQQQQLNAIQAHAAAIAASPTTPADMRKDLADTVAGITVLNAHAAELQRAAKENHNLQVDIEQQRKQRHAFLVAAAQDLPRLKQQLIVSQQQYHALLQEQMASQALLPELAAFQGQLVMHLITSLDLQPILQAQQVPLATATKTAVIFLACYSEQLFPLLKKQYQQLEQQLSGGWGGRVGGFVQSAYDPRWFLAVKQAAEQVPMGPQAVAEQAYQQAVALVPHENRALLRSLAQALGRHEQGLFLLKRSQRLYFGAWLPWFGASRKALGGSALAVMALYRAYKKYWLRA